MTPEAEKQRLEITRGDSAKWKFRRLDNNNEPILVKADKVYFTVKNSFEDSDAVFQKTIDDMEFDNEGYYSFTVDPDDTNGLPFGYYVFDVEVIIEGIDYKKTIAKGDFIIKEEATSVENEV